MADAEYAFSVFQRHFNRVELSSKKGGFAALELGPGDSVASAVIARTFGAKTCFLVDSGKFAAEDSRIYRDIVELLKAKGFEPEDIPEPFDLAAVLRQFGGIYLTEGIDSLRIIPDESVDFIWSQAVLEHVRLKEFDATLSELRRIIREGGACSHRVDLKDHLGDSLNNLRFSQTIWEADWMATSGFYTNRIRFHDMLERFERAGFASQVIQVDRWSDLPLSKARMAVPFRLLKDKDLLIKGFDVLLRPRVA